MEIKAGVESSTNDALALQAVGNMSVFESTNKQTMAHTPEKALIHAANFCKDQETAIMTTEDLITQFVLPEDTSMDFADAPSTPVQTFGNVQHALGALENRMKAAEEGIGKTAAGLFDALNNYQTLSDVIAGSYKSLEAKLGTNSDPNSFMSVWEGVQHVKEVYMDLDSKFRGSQTLNRNTMAKVTQDITALMNRVGKLRCLTTKLEGRIDEARIDVSNTINSLVPNYLPDSFDGPVHPLFYHIAFGVDNFFNRLDFNIDKYADKLDKVTANVGERESKGAKEGIAALKEQVAKLTAIVKKLQTPDHGRLVQIGTQVFHEPDDVQEFSKNLTTLSHFLPCFGGYATTCGISVNALQASAVCKRQKVKLLTNSIGCQD